MRSYPQRQMRSYPDTRPQPPGEALTVDLPTAPTRSLEAYAFGEILR